MKPLSLLSLTILVIGLTVGADESSDLDELTQIHSKLMLDDEDDGQVVHKLFEKFRTLRDKIGLDNLTRQGFDQKIHDIDSLIEKNIEATVKNYIATQENLGPVGRREFYDEINKLRSYVSSSYKSQKLIDLLANVDRVSLSLLIGEVYRGLNTPLSEASSSTSSSSSSLQNRQRLIEEYGSLRRRVFDEKINVGDKVRGYMDKIDPFYFDYTIYDTYSKLVNFNLDSAIFDDNTVKVMNEILTLDQESLNNMLSRDQRIGKMIDTLRDFFVQRVDSNNCSVEYFVRYEHLRRRYESMPQLHRYLMVMMQNQLDVCRQVIEVQIVDAWRNDPSIDAAFARFNLLTKIIIDHASHLVDDLFDLNIYAISSGLVLYFEHFGYTLPRRTRITEEYLKIVDESFDLYLKEYCRRLRPKFLSSYSLVNHIVMHRYLDFNKKFYYWTVEMVRANNICKKIEKLDGRDWYLATVFDYHDLKGNLLNKKRPTEPSAIFDDIEDLIKIAPALSKVLGNKEELDLLPVYKRVVELSKKDVEEFQVEWFEELKSFRKLLVDVPQLNWAIDDLSTRRSINVLNKLREEIDETYKKVGSDGMYYMAELRDRVQKKILKRKTTIKDNMLAYVLKPGVTREDVEYALEGLDSIVQKRKREGEPASQKFEPITGKYHQKTEQACKIILEQSQETYSNLWKLQEQGLFGLFQRVHVEFMADFVICRSFPFPGESSGAGSVEIKEEKTNE